MRHYPCLAALLATLAVVAPAFASNTLAGQRPNIIFILADDLGYGDLGCYGQKVVKTPRLDQMAAEGVRFTDGYAGSAVCAPSRATLLTGLHTGHTKVRKNGDPLFAAAEKTAAEVLKNANYRTAVFGKWGMAKAGGDGAPEAHGFDETLVYLTHTQAHDYTPDQLWKNGQPIKVTSGTYAPDLFTSAALQFISTRRDNPYFLYLAYTTPHAHNALGKDTGNGMEIPSDAPYSGEDWPQPQKNHAAMITALDRHVGMVLNALQENGQAENTLVLFSSDNGPHKEGGAKPEFFDSNGQLRGIKRDLYEGGIRVPFIAWWPGKLAPATNRDPVAFWDFVPTVAELAGAELLHQVDGKSLLPALTGQAITGRDFLYWELEDRSKLGAVQVEQRAVRMGNWKAIRRDQGTELYDLSQDPGENYNIAANHPDVVAKAEGLFQTARTPPPGQAGTVGE